jgi:hypothetical protein
MESFFNQSSANFETLNEKEMNQLKGGVMPNKDRDVFDPDEH